MRLHVAVRKRRDPAFIAQVGRLQQISESKSWHLKIRIYPMLD